MESRAYKWYCDRVWRQPQKKMSLITFTLGTVVPFYPRFWFARFQLPMANCIPKILNEKFQKWTVPRFLNCTAFWAALISCVSWETHDMRDYQKANSSLCHSLRFISSHRHFILSHHPKKKDEYKKLFWERSHSYNFYYGILS